MELLYEGVHIFESSIYGSEPDVGHRVERAQALHDHLSDALAGELALARVHHHGLDRVGHALELLLRDRALAAGHLQPAHQIQPVVLLAALVALDDLERQALDALVAREAPLAMDALPAAPDHVPLPALARIHHTVFHTTAKRAPHRAPYITVEGAERRGRGADGCVAACSISCKNRSVRDDHHLRPAPCPLRPTAVRRASVPSVGSNSGLRGRKARAPNS